MSRIQELEAEVARLRSELEHHKAESAARAAHEARASLFVDVSHDLRTPLTLILAPIEEMLSTGALPARMRQGLRRIQRNAARMRRTLDGVLDLAAADGGALVPRPEVVDLGQLVADIVADAEVVTRSRGIDMAFKRDAKLPAVQIDPQLFERIAINLIANALDFTPQDGVIEVNLAISAQEVELRVRDTGAGIAAEARKHLFERFAGRGTDGSGAARTGLGLAVVAKLVELMNGRVSVDSEVGKGSVFTVALPVPADRDGPVFEPRAALPAAPPAAWPSSPRSRFASEPADAPGMRASSEADFMRAPLEARARVLVVEDAADMRAYIQELIEREFDVVAVADGTGALGAMQEQAFDVVIADVMMPDMNGFELVSTIKSNPLLAHIPIILVTARGAGEAALGLDIGADDYLDKPFAPVELMARVRAARRTAEMQRLLADESYMAGMAEVASQLVHEVGHVMSRVQESLHVLGEQLDAAWAPASLGQLVKKLEQKEKGLDETTDIFHLPVYLNSLATQLSTEQRVMSTELDVLKSRLGHIESVIRAQQEMARYAGVTEMVVPGELIDEALDLCVEGLAGTGIDVLRNEDDMPPMGIDRHRVMHIVAQLIDNARASLAAVERDDKVITVVARCIDNARLSISVSDNGRGLDAEAQARVFEPGFAQPDDGSQGAGEHSDADASEPVAQRHTLGLHAAAEVAVQLGGELRCHSEGPEQGTMFTLDLPFTPIAGQGRG